MKRVLLAIVSTTSALVVLLSFKTHAVAPSVAAAAAGSTATTTTPAPAPTAPTPTTPTTSRTGTRTITGSSVDTRWGPVQVQITVTDGAITAAQAVVFPQDNPRDQEINAYAVPTLNSEAVAANSAAIDVVSGATYTSNGYISSLQSALDQL